jgi:hypothetical protein
MTTWRDTHPIWVPPGTWTVRGGPTMAWEGVYPTDHIYHWAPVLGPVGFVRSRGPVDGALLAVLERAARERPG